ncbi:MAG: nascent polypeptide-associated complex protein [DPANN group archaeon]|nr:nascent polypeptide-associated complex protein [DPANN group archaeon]
MMPGMNPKQMKNMMKQMGMQMVEIKASEVVIKCADKEIIIINPQVSKVKAMGQETFQIVGDISERSFVPVEKFTQSDVHIVVDQTGVSEEKARTALEETDGDLAEAIMKVQE